MEINYIGALIGLALAIILIVKKQVPFYSLLLGAFIGGIIGGGTIPQTVDLMVDGAKGITPAVLRILGAGVLAGVLIESGGAFAIATKIVSLFGKKFSLLALAIATMILTSIGVFVDIAVITVSPIALVIGRKNNIPKMALLLAMVGGGKSGNIISPNPNTIAVSENFQVGLSQVIGANIIPALVGVVVAFLISRTLAKKEGEQVMEEEIPVTSKELPNFSLAIIGPLVTVILLALRPIAKINIDPLVALPAGGIVGAIAMGKGKKISEYISFGLSKMSGVAILLMGTGALAGIIKGSNLKDAVLNLLNSLHVPEYLLAPISGAFMSAATASTTSGATIASATFGEAILKAGIAGVAGAAMVHAGAVVLDHLPHGSFFHATAGSTNMKFKERLKVVPYESLVGFIITFTSTLINGIL